MSSSSNFHVQRLLWEGECQSLHALTRQFACESRFHGCKDLLHTRGASELDDGYAGLAAKSEAEFEVVVGGRSGVGWGRWYHVLLCIGALGVVEVGIFSEPAAQIGATAVRFSNGLSDRDTGLLVPRQTADLFLGPFPLPSTSCLRLGGQQHVLGVPTLRLPEGPCIVGLPVVDTHVDAFDQGEHCPPVQTPSVCPNLELVRRALSLAHRISLPSSSSRPSRKKRSGFSALQKSRVHRAHNTDNPRLFHHPDGEACSSLAP